MDADEKRLVLKDFNHRLNNDLQALLAFIKLQKRFGIDADEIIGFSYVSTASVSAIQNLMYYSNHEENFISTENFFNEFIKILNDYYARSGIEFVNESGEDFAIHPKKAFHLMLLINQMICLSVSSSLDGASDKHISFDLKKSGDECHLKYSDSGSGIGAVFGESEIHAMLFDQLVKQIEGTRNATDDDSNVSISFEYHEQ